jgi:hypothetical protein
MRSDHWLVYLLLILPFDQFAIGCKMAYMSTWTQEFSVVPSPYHLWSGGGGTLAVIVNELKE